MGFNNADISLEGVQLFKSSEYRRKEHGQMSLILVIVIALLYDVGVRLYEFLIERTDIENKLMVIVKPFVSLSPDADLKEVHGIICFYTGLTNLNTE